jgi:hypothetical protein
MESRDILWRVVERRRTWLAARCDAFWPNPEGQDTVESKG